MDGDAERLREPEREKSEDPPSWLSIIRPRRIGLRPDDEGIEPPWLYVSAIYRVLLGWLTELLRNLCRGRSSSDISSSESSRSLHDFLFFGACPDAGASSLGSSKSSSEPVSSPTSGISSSPQYASLSACSSSSMSPSSKTITPPLRPWYDCNILPFSTPGCRRTSSPVVESSPMGVPNTFARFHGRLASRTQTSTSPVPPWPFSSISMPNISSMSIMPPTPRHTTTPPLPPSVVRMGRTSSSAARDRSP